MDIYAQFWFDTEDFITPEADDALLALLTMLKGKNVPVTFKLVGEKARVLERRRRHDIIGLLQNTPAFEIGYHTEFHSVHPTISEYCEHMGFAEGRDAFFARENPGRLDVERIAGKKCVCYGQPGNTWAPQAYPALLEMGIPVYMDSHTVIDGGKNPYWFGGMLNYLDIQFYRMELGADYGENLRGAGEGFEAFEKSRRFLNIYYHPCEFSCTEFYDGVNFAKGNNPPRENWKPAALRTPGQMQGLIANLSEFVDFLLGRGVKLIGPSALLEMEASKNRRGMVPEDIVMAWAEKAAGGEVDYCVGDGCAISCVEGLSLAAKKILGKPLQCAFAHGPEKEVRVQAKSFDDDMAHELAKAVLGFFEASKGDKTAQLPDTFDLPGIKIPPLDAAVILSRALVHGERGPIEARLRPAELVNPNEDWSGWIIHREDFRVPNILAMAKRQMWTFKPAVF